MYCLSILALFIFSGTGLLISISKNNWNKKQIEYSRQCLGRETILYYFSINSFISTCFSKAFEILYEIAASLMDMPHNTALTAFSRSSLSYLQVAMIHTIHMLPNSVPLWHIIPYFPKYITLLSKYILLGLGK